MSVSLPFTLGARYGLYTTIAIEFDGKRKRWKCRCDCGTVKAVSPHALIKGTTVSCGCYALAKHAETAARVFRKHGYCVDHPKEYDAWKNIQYRCDNPRHESYKRYGGRGITMWRSWRDSFETFLRDVGKAPSPHHWLDRTDNDGNYEPGNVKWVTPKRSGSNRSVNYNVTYLGRTQTLAEWSRETGIEFSTLRFRLRDPRWTLKEAMTAPVDQTHQGIRRRRRPSFYRARKP